MATAPFALTRPARLLSKPVLFRVAPASVTNLPPWLFNSPRLVTSRLPALEKVPAWLLTWSAFTVSDPSLTKGTAPLVVQCTTERYIHQALAAEQAAIAIEQFSAVQVQSIATGEHTLGLVQQALHR